MSTLITIDRERVRARLLRYTARRIRQTCEIPEEISVTDYCERERVLPETSSSPGAYDPNVVPYARKWQDMGADPSVSRMVLCWASQTTKSTVIENIIMHRIVHMPSPMVIVQPKIDAAEAWSKERFVPMVKACRALRDRVKLGRSSGSTLRYMSFPGGFAFIASAQSATELASRSASFVASDEVDRMEVIPGEGSPVEIVSRRTGSADVGFEIITSTPRAAESTVVWPYLEGGTLEYFHVPCPHCGFPQRLVWDRLKWEPGQPETAYYVCVECGATIDEKWKPKMLEAGTWVATNPKAPYPSSHLHGLYSPFARSGWGVIAGEFVRAQGKPADLQVVVNTRFAELWQETADIVDPESLLQRLEPVPEGVVPRGVGIVTAGVDVQHNRLEVYVWGWGAGLESWLILSAVLPGDPQKEPDQPGSVWAKLDEILAKKFPHEDSGGIPCVPIAITMVDSGHAASQVYRFTNARRGKNVFAAKGIGGDGHQLIGKPTLQGKERVILYMVGVDRAKTEFLRSQIYERQPGPGFVHLPDWLTTDQCKQLVSEKRSRRIERGRVVLEWRKKNHDDPNEALDCRNYARAGLEERGAKVIANLGLLAKNLEVTAKSAAFNGVAPSTSPRRMLSRGLPRDG